LDCLLLLPPAPALRPGGGRDDVRPIAHGFVALDVAQAVLAHFGLARFDRRARVNERAVVVRAERLPALLTRATALYLHAVEAALAELDSHLTARERGGFRRRLGVGNRGAPARASRLRLDDAEGEAD